MGWVASGGKVGEAPRGVINVIGSSIYNEGFGGTVDPVQLEELFRFFRGSEFNGDKYIERSREVGQTKALWEMFEQQYAYMTVTWGK
ncbi:MAG TPA: hypothetical protein PKW33_19880 [Anaerolineaceae bacterium]|nr:hypothetical protein [Anaerolineaceae bacterium]HPN53866.1 hypothetical protein [Anaerolineaceae bacterium]